MNIIATTTELKEHQQAVFAVPFPYLQMAQQKINGKQNVFIAAQNCYSKKSAHIQEKFQLKCCNHLTLSYVVIGHSERREYFHESNQFLAEK